MTVKDDRNEGGIFVFDSLTTSLPSDPANFVVYGNSFASFLLGQTFIADWSKPAPLRTYFDSMWGFYGEDTIKLTPKLTLSLGLRYELPIYAKEVNGITSFLDINTPNPGAGNLPGALVFLGKGQGRTGTYSMFGSYHYAFSPRISLTYALNKATVLRAGYGVFRIYPDYGRLNGCNYWCAGFSEEVLQYSMDFINPIFPLDQGVPSTPNPPIFDPALNNGGAVSWINENANKPAFMGSWTLDVQRDLPFQMMLDVAYVGSTTVHTWTGLENINQVDPKYLSLGNLLYKNVYDGGAVAQGIKPPYAGFQGSVAQALRPYAQYNSIGDMYQPTGYADYESLQVRFQKRFSKGLSFLVAYTYSKELGVPGSDTLGDTAGGGSVMALDTYNRRIEKAVVPWNEPQALAFSWMYELPVGRGKHFLPNLSSPLNQVIGGWQINTIQTYHSGVPISVTGGPPVPCLTVAAAETPTGLTGFRLTCGQQRHKAWAVSIPTKTCTSISTPLASQLHSPWATPLPTCPT